MAGGALPGFRDFYPDEFAHRAHIFRAWREVARRFAFVEYDGPPLEPLELYTKKSGDEIVKQLYSFTDKGGREVALRPEMTPTFARMVAAKANALRKPVRWFSIPQLFRYERAQRGRLREHFQLNVDIVGEASELADAELLAVAIDVLRELGLGPLDVRARVSDRRLLNALLAHFGVTDDRIPPVYAVIDKIGRQPPAVSRDKLVEAGLAPASAAHVLALASGADLPALEKEFARVPHVRTQIERMVQFLGHLGALGVRDWVQLDLSIVRGLAYYTGIVFELFDVKGELRAICGGGRYDTLLKSLGGADLPALGFGMGDVVLGELLRRRGLLPGSAGSGADLFLVGGPGATTSAFPDALRLVQVLRDARIAVDYVLNGERYVAQALRNQLDSAKKSGAVAAIYFGAEGDVLLHPLRRKLSDEPTRFAARPVLARDGKTLAELRRWIENERAAVITD